MLRSRTSNDDGSGAARVALLRGVAAIFAGCYALTLVIHGAHRADWLRPHTFAIAVPGALMIFALAGIVPAAIFAALRFRLRFWRPLGALWLACALTLTVAAATAPL